MATVKSTWITNAETVPKVGTNAASSAGELREASSVATVSATIPSGDIVRMVRVPSNCRISAVLISTADATTAGAVDIGLYQTTENGGAVVDADFFSTALDLTGGPFKRSDQTYKSGAYTYALSAKPLWEALSLSVDPEREYDVCLTVTTTGDGMGTTIGLLVRYAA